MRIHHINRQGRRFAACLTLLILLGNGLFGQNPTIDPPRDWATTVGGVNFDFITDAVTDGQGGLYVTGYTNSPNFPTTLAGSPGAGYDAFVARFDSLGNVLWSTRYGGSGTDYGNAIARDAAGNILVAGKLGGQGTFVTDSTDKGTGDDILVLKLSGSGAFIAALRYGGSGADEAVGISTDANNQMVVVGNSSSTNISTTSATFNGTSGDAFVLRLRSNLSRHLAFRYGGNSFDKANDVVIDSQGNFYVAGETGSADYPQTISTYQGGGGAKAFVMRFDSLGARTWAQRYGGAGVERAYALDLPANGGLLVAGYTTSTDFPTTINGLGGSGLDAFLLHLNLDGTRDYARRLGGSLDDLCLDIASDASGNVFMAGETQSLNFPSTNNRFKGQGRDQFLAKFSPAGVYEWSFPYGGTQNDFSGGALASGAASVYLAGHTQSINYPQTLTGTGGTTARGAVLRLRDCLGQDADFSFQHVCEFDTVHFQNLSVRGTSDTLAYRWWFGDGDSTDVFQPSHYYSVPGTYQVTLRVTSPCGVDSTITHPVNVYPGPRAEWTHANACATRYTDFMDSTTLDTIVGSYEDDWTWDFGNGDSSTLQNPTYIYPAPGTYTVHFTVMTNHGCVDTASHTVVVHHRPYADFLTADVCLRDTAFFADSTQLAGDSLVAWSWDFGNGNNSTVQHPNHLYLVADTFVVDLIVTTNEGCTDTVSKPIKVLPLPVVNFGMTAICWPDTVAYTDSSTIVGDLISAFEWHFGDGVTDTLQNSWHAYAASGTYDVVLWVYTASGCADSLLQSLKVNDKPTAQFTTQDVCWPEAMQFNDSSSVLADSLVAWNWTFGDSTGDTIPSPSHTYVVANTYSVSLEVVSAFGCRDTAVQNVTVFPKPAAFFTPANVCFPLPMTLADGSTVQGGTINQWQWDFGDGTTGFLPFTAHPYANAGVYLVTLAVQSSDGCRDTIMDSVEVYPQPVADFVTENVCDGDTVFFTDSSSITSGTIDTYAYTFGDGNGSASADTAWVYAQPGTYVLSLMVTSNHNCINMALGSVTVHALPDPQPAVVGYADICIGDTVVLQEAQPFAQYEWETGDTTSWISLQGRSDWVVLTVTDSNSCVNSDSVEVRFHPVPRPNAVITPGPEVFSCSNDSLFLNAGGSYFSYLWSNGSSTDIQYVTQSGPISVLVFNGFGCADTSDTAMVTISQAPTSPVVTQNGNVLTSDPATAYQWYIDGMAIPNATGQVHIATATGSYVVEVTNAAGCSEFSNAVSMLVGTGNVFISDFRVYPNPIQDETHLAGNLKKGGMLEMRLHNATGQLVLQETVSVSAGAFEHTFNTADLPSGYYLCEILLGQERIVKALVKQ
jgi:PKD repeat protein